MFNQIHRMYNLYNYMKVINPNIGMLLNNPTLILTNNSIELFEHSENLKM